MIKGAASIGNFLLDVYEEKVRSSPFKGLNNEETMIPLKHATGAGDWIVTIASENESGYYWYKTYDENNDPSTTTVHLPYYEGVAGIASYLSTEHNSTYADYAMRALNYLINVAYDTTGYAWNEDYGQGPDKLSTRWSKGSHGIGAVFLEAYRLSHNSTFRDVAMGLYTWLDSASRPTPTVLSGTGTHLTRHQESTSVGGMVLQELHPSSGTVPRNNPLHRSARHPAP